MIHQLTQVVQNGFDGINGRLDSMQAMIENGRTRALNLRASPDATHMLRKTVRVHALHGSIADTF